MSHAWGRGQGKRLHGRARTGLGGLSRARPIVVQLAHRSEALDVGSNEPGEWFRRVEEAAEQYMKHWFVTEKEKAAKRRALEVQTSQQSKTSLKPRPGEGMKRSWAEGGVAAAARRG